MAQASPDTGLGANHAEANNARTSRNLKRPADDDLQNEQRLSKRFDLLNLEHNGKLWVKPAPPPRPLELDNTSSDRSDGANEDYMQIEETKDRIYIHNLDQELAEDEESPEEEPLVFISDVERHLSQIPKHLLQGGDFRREGPSGHELVLYNVPSSLSLPVEQDSVRKAIIESRLRARKGHGSTIVTPSQEERAPRDFETDGDAMDVG